MHQIGVPNFYGPKNGNTLFIKFIQVTVTIYLELFILNLRQMNLLDRKQKK